jgi:SOS response regulatory protein OraA/RecX
MTETRLSSSTDRRGRAAEHPPLQRAFDFALARLARRSYGEQELRRKLEQAGYPAPEIDEAVVHLLEKRYLDDTAFAAGLARDRARKGWGPARIAFALRERGIREPDITAALAEAFPEGELAAAGRALARFCRASRVRLGERKGRARAYRHLLARGYSPEAIMKTLGRVR